MSYIIFDTETTCLPDFKKTGIDRYLDVHIISIAWVKYDSDSNIVFEKDYILRIAEDVKVNPRAEEVHGISAELSRKIGNNAKDVISEFFSDLEECDMLLAYNIVFDYNVLMAYLYRTKQRGLATQLVVQNIDCIMQLATEVLNEFKWPRLCTAYFRICKNKEKDDDNFHDALFDVKIAGDIYSKILDGYTIENAFDKNKSKRILKMFA